MKQFLQLSILIFITLPSCVSSQQQFNDQIDEIIEHAYKGTIINNIQLYKDRITEEINFNNPSNESILNRSIVSRLGEPIMKIYKDYLLFEVQHSGPNNPTYQLIWDGMYQVDYHGNHHVNLVYFLQLHGKNKAIDCNYLGFNLTQLKSSKVQEVILHFYGIDETIKYNY